MNREEITLLGFEIVAFAGDARSRLMEALAAASGSSKPKAWYGSLSQPSALQQPLAVDPSRPSHSQPQPANHLGPEHPSNPDWKVG